MICDNCNNHLSEIEQQFYLGLPDQQGALREKAMETPDQLVEYAQKIAVYRAYTNLENGLQPLDVLNTKFEHERQEFDDAIARDDILASIPRSSRSPLL